MKNNREFRDSVFAKAEKQRRIRKEKRAARTRMALAVVMLLLVAVPAVYIPLSFSVGNISTAASSVAPFASATSASDTISGTKTLPVIISGTGSSAKTEDVTTENTACATTADTTAATTANATDKTTAGLTAATTATVSTAATGAGSAATTATLVTTGTAETGAPVGGVFYNGAFAYRIADEAGGAQGECYRAYPDGKGLSEYATGYVGESFFERNALIVLKVTVRGVPRLENISAESGFELAVRADAHGSDEERGTWIMLVPVPKSAAPSPSEGINIVIK